MDTCNDCGEPLDINGACYECDLDDACMYLDGDDEEDLYS